MYPRKLFIVIVSLPKEFSLVSHCQCGLFGQTDPTGLRTKVVPQLAVSSLLLPLFRPILKTHL